MPLISVVIPCYNSRRFILHTLSSVFSQKGIDMEVIVVDNGSSDGTIEEVKRHFPSVALLHQSIPGASAARNMGLFHSQGEYVAFLDADDLWAPEKLKIQLRYLPCDFLYTDAQIFGEGDAVGKRRGEIHSCPSGKVLEELLLNNFITTSSVLIKRDILIKEGGFDESFYAIEDWELWLRIAKDREITFIPLPLVLYRLHPHSLSADRDKNLFYSLRVLDKFFSSNGDFSARIKRKAYRNIYQIFAMKFYKEGDLSNARKMFFRAMICYPLSKRPIFYMGKAFLGLR